MKIRKKLSLGLLSFVAVSAPTIAVISCSSVNGEIEIKVSGLNKDGTDYVIDVNVSEQFIAKIIEKNAKDTKNINDIITNIILEKVKNMLPDSYKSGEFKNLKPSISLQSRTKFKIKVPIKSVITNLPDLAKAKQEMNKKYVKSKAMWDVQKKYENSLFIPKNFAKMSKKDKKDFLLKRYSDKKNGQIAKKDFIDFNFLGFMPYAVGKLTNDLLKQYLNMSYDDVEDFLSKKFKNKKDKDQIKLQVTLPSTFEIVEFQNQQVDVYFYITNIKEIDESKSTTLKKVYKSKDASGIFDPAKNDKADIHYSLFLKKQLSNKNEASTVEVDNKLDSKKSPTIKIEETGVEEIFIGLKKGQQISRVVDVNSKKSGYKFNFKTNPNGFIEKKLNNAISSNLFTKTEKKDQDKNVLKDNDKNILYEVKPKDKYKAIITFDIDEIKMQDKANNWIVKTGENAAIVEKDDQVTYSNFKVEYQGLPFSGGEKINYQGIKDYLGFIFGFDKQMENMNVANQKIITPIFPKDYQKKQLQSKLAKFIIKVNDIKHRKVISSQFLKDLKIKNGDKKIIKTKKEYNDYLKFIFKNKIWEEFAKNYLFKTKVKVPESLVQKFYFQLYIQSYVKMKGKINKKTLTAIKKQSLAQANFSEIEKAFYRVNKTIGNEIVDKRKTFLDELFNSIK